MEKSQNSQKARHPIGVVARRTGIAPDLLRAWERRYHAVDPGRAPAGRRLYSDGDIERLRLLRRLVEGGRRISDVAHLPLAELEKLVAEDELELEQAPAARPSPPSSSARAYLEEALAAVEKLDRVRLERTIANASVDLSAPVFRKDFIVPLMYEVGERWHEGSMRIMHEHLTTVTVRGFLASLTRGLDRASNGPGIVVTTLAGQAHEIGALLAAGTAADIGWKVYYLGPDMPAEDIAAAVRQTGAQAVALSIVHPARDPKLMDELRRLREYLGPEVAIYVGGGASTGFEEVLAEVDAVTITDLQRFQRELEIRLAS